MPPWAHKAELPRPPLPQSSVFTVWRKTLMLAKGEPRLLPGTHFPNPCAWTPIDPSITLLSYAGPVYSPDLCCFQGHCDSVPTCQEFGVSVVLGDWTDFMTWISALVSLRQQRRLFGLFCGSGSPGDLSRTLPCEIRTDCCLLKYVAVVLDNAKVSSRCRIIH